MKRLVLSLLLLPALTWGQKNQKNPYPIPPTHAEIRYGTHERNVLDLWIARSDKPTPLAIYAHGGGFAFGSKETIESKYLKTLKELLDNGISVASINYRYCTDEKEGALASIKDAKRALQYLRYHAAEFNIDKQKIGIWGNSAGAGVTLWIAFHDETADPSSSDPVLRESSRPQAAYAEEMQTTYDTFQWPGLLGMSEKDSLLTKLHELWTPKWLGIESIAQKDTPHGLRMRKELDIISLLSEDDPPFMVTSSRGGDIPPTIFGYMIHHPLFAKIMYEKGKKCGLDCRASTPKAPQYNLNDKTTIPEFFIMYLK